MTRRELLKNFRSLTESSVDALFDILDMFPKQVRESIFLPRLNKNMNWLLGDCLTSVCASSFIYAGAWISSKALKSGILRPNFIRFIIHLYLFLWEKSVTLQGSCNIWVNKVSEYIMRSKNYSLIRKEKKFVRLQFESFLEMKFSD